jgi:arginine deiminase
LPVPRKRSTIIIMIKVTSDIGRLRAVLLHRPGRELERLTPRYLEEMLFDDIPWLKKIRQEHDFFAKTLRDHGCKVFYYQELLSKVLQSQEIREKMIDEVIASCRLGSDQLKGIIREYLQDMEASQLAEVFISGLEKSEIDNLHETRRLSSYIREAYPFYINPLTNLYFTRDPGVVIEGGVAVHAMKTPARMRESLILKGIRDYHPVFSREEGSDLGADREKDGPSLSGDSEKDSQVPLWYSPEDLDSIEGGDVLVLSPTTIVVGCSARTGAEGIQRLAERLFQGTEKIREVLVIQIPFTRAFMHLDTVLTMIDRDTFTIFPGIRDKLALFRLTPARNGGIRISPQDSLEKSLRKPLGLPAVRLIESGGGDDLTAAREQWNDSTNTLALSPGVVVTYDRNVASNETLRKAGIEVVEIEGSELVRGRGGPRCMSMPLWREDL